MGAGVLLLGGAVAMSWASGSGRGERADLESKQVAAPAPVPNKIEAPKPVEPVNAPEPGVAKNDDMAVTVSFDRPLVAPGAREATAMIEVAIPEGAARGRRPAAIAIVLDRSGSMKGNKMDNARRAAHGLVDRLEDGDTVSVVSFNAKARVHLANFAIGDDRGSAHAAIDDIDVSGNTCMSCGMSEAYALLGQAPQGHARRAVVLSDGEANRGDKSAYALGDLADAGLVDFRIATSSVGIGKEYDIDIMRTVSERGTGGYYFVHNSRGIGDVLAREAETLASSVVDNVEVRIAPLSRSVALEDGSRGREHHVKIGQMAAGTSRRVVVPLRLMHGELGEVLEVETSYVDVDGAERVLVARGTVVRADNEAESEGSEDPNVVSWSARQSTPAVVTVALDAYDNGDVDDAVAKLEAQAEVLEKTAAATGSGAPAKEASEVRQIVKRVKKHKPRSRGAVITRRLNDARNSEVNKGFAADDMYYEGDTANAGEYKPADLE
jgi:Ca-activated chloride channel family protein